MKLLVTGAWNCTDEQLNELHTLGFDIVFMQNEKDELPDGAVDAEGIICNGLFLHHDIKQFERLKFIQLTSAGYDRVPLDYIREKSISIFNARGVYSIPMAEFALCGVLQLYKKSCLFSDSKTKHEWKKQREIRELYGKTVCVLGCGSVGTEVAKRFSAFGCKVNGVDKFTVNNDVFDSICKLDELDTVLSDSDIVVLTLPLTDETKGLFDTERFNAMKRESVLVNIARGQIVNAEALIKALEDGKIYGAVLDVFENEPLETDSLLWNMENVIVTPHNSFVGEGNGMRLWNNISKNLEGITKII